MNVKQLYDELLPYYHSLYDACATIRDKNGNAVDLKEYAVFFPQVGKLFPETTRDGILFVGQSANSWKSTLAEPLDRVSADQLVTTNIQEGCSTSYFKKCMLRVASAFYTDNWFDYIAWTNLYKASPVGGGNPFPYLKQIEHEACDTILKKEIELLSPKYVVFITGWNWLNNFSIGKAMPNNPNQITSVDWVSTKKWGKLVVKKWVADGITYILTERPDRRGIQNETNLNNLVATICKLM